MTACWQISSHPSPDWGECDSEVVSLLNLSVKRMASYCPRTDFHRNLVAQDCNLGKVKIPGQIHAQACSLGSHHLTWVDGVVGQFPVDYLWNWKN